MAEIDEILLTQILDKINRFFTVDTQKQTGKFTIENGVVTVNFKAVPGQYIRIQNAIMNDGVYMVDEVTEAENGYHIKLSERVIDESFTGAIHGLAIPSDFMQLALKIQNFCEKSKDKDPTVTSESYAGSSRTWSTGSNGAVLSWQSSYISDLGQYRRFYDRDKVVSKR